MTNEIMSLEIPELSTVEKSRAEQIKATFQPMADRLKTFENDYDAIIKEAEKEITEEVTKDAKSLRLGIAKVRIATDKLRKAEKDEYLRAGKAIDGVSNILKWAISDKEDKLKEIENHFELMELKKFEELQSKRAKELSLYVEDAYERSLADMDQDVWVAYFQSKKKAHEDRLAAEKKAEEDRVAKEKAEALERERIKKENEKLKKEAKERERVEKLEAEKRAKEAAKLRVKEEAERKKREKAERKQREEREQYEANKKADREEYKRIEDEKKARIEAEQDKENERLAEEKRKQEAENKRIKDEQDKAQKKIDDEKAKLAEDKRLKEEEEEARVQAELTKGDTDKVKDLILDLINLSKKYSFKSAKNKKMYSAAKGMIIETVDFIERN